MQDMPAQKVDQAIKNSLAIDLWRVTSMRKRRGRVAEARPGGGGAAGWRRRGQVAEARPGGAHIFLWATFFVFLSRRYSLPRSGWWVHALDSGGHWSTDHVDSHAAKADSYQTYTRYMF
jgi:hypothetical protein